ncbi:hypothetical protein HDE76_002358 [Rhodanobacter sp. ANJX3]|uniref:hypothetical protein n=1 Tax=Rhodanobacter sp. ANJX3 TaxID=2723083 RepID=UPI001616EEB8|nr:hypothetical protein [Rhodanobacter sp. ANJX3]MBB5359142.1 hypothetical protein [Rhodanobacter sp. ANJX3]
MPHNLSSVTFGKNQSTAIDAVTDALEENITGLIALDAHERCVRVKTDDPSKAFARHV